MFDNILWPTIILCFSQFFLAGLGVIVSMKPRLKKKHKLILIVSFILLWLISTGAVVWQHLASEASVKQRQEDIKKEIKESGSGLKKQMSAIGQIAQPKPPEKAKVEFTFWPPLESEPIRKKMTLPIESGIVTVDFSAKNTSTVHVTNPVTVWITICEGCEFTEEPKGLENINPPNNVVRRMKIAPLPAGVSYEPIKLKIIPPSAIYSFPITFKYSCNECPPVDDKHPQILWVNLRDDYLENYLRRTKQSHE